MRKAHCRPVKTVRLVSVTVYTCQRVPASKTGCGCHHGHVNGLNQGGSCPLDPQCPWHPEFPPGYQEPALTGDRETDRVPSAQIASQRATVIAGVISAHMRDDHGLNDVVFEWMETPE